jgi:2-hydroxychromene-2-carboxylate isomerase
VTLRADLYWSFRSPYSYFAIGRYRAMTQGGREAHGLRGATRLYGMDASI